MIGPARVPVIVEFGAGNVGSLRNALARLQIDATIIRDPSALDRADTIVFPGVGAFGPAMERLRASGLADAVCRAARDGLAGRRRFLGICIGMQVLFERSEEAPTMAGLGVLAGGVERLLEPKVPHMGWNALEACAPGTPLAGLDGRHAYFVHSYAARASDAAASWTTHGASRFVSAIARGGLIATQFHPEKSGAVGLAILRRFLRVGTS